MGRAAGIDATGLGAQSPNQARGGVAHGAARLALPGDRRGVWTAGVKSFHLRITIWQFLVLFIHLHAASPMVHFPGFSTRPISLYSERPRYLSTIFITASTFFTSLILVTLLHFRQSPRVSP